MFIWKIIKHKSVMRFVFLLLTALLIFSSCTIEKRTFNKGYYVSWNKQKYIQTFSKDKQAEAILLTEKKSPKQQNTDTIQLNVSYTSNSEVVDSLLTETIALKKASNTNHSIQIRSTIYSPKTLQAINSKHQIDSTKNVESNSSFMGFQPLKSVALILLIIASFLILFGVSFLLFPFEVFITEILGIIFIVVGILLLPIALLLLLLSLILESF